MKHAILCIDDEVDNVEALERLFRKKFKVFKATSGQEALKILESNPVSVIISDQRMPNMTGVEFLEQSIRTHPDAIRILLTGYTDIDSVISAINAGRIYRYVTKPWDPVDLSTAVDRAVERYEIGEELKVKNAALQAALEELQTLDQAKNNFMILVNHELKTPLTSILSFSDLLSGTRLDEEQSLYLARVKTSAQRLQEMVNDVLEFISAETKLTPVDTRPLSPADLFSPIPDVVQALMQKKQLSLAPNFEKRKILADEKLMRNISRRLLHNAVKFSPEGGEIRIDGVVCGKNRYRVTISNPSEPIPDLVVRQILKPFTLNESIMNHSQGIGMGLSVCQSLLRLQNASLALDSTDGLIRVSFETPLE